jgi:hypothetical protein
MPRAKLEEIIDNFKVTDFAQFFRLKNQAQGNFRLSNERLSQYNDSDFSGLIKLGQIEYSATEKLIVIGAEVKKDLSERSGKKNQYEKAKKILKELAAYSAGIFIFYDATGNFRFSLVYPEAVGHRREWSNFRRFTYFVSKEFTNKTFLSRIGEGDFSSLIKIKDVFSVEKVTKEFYLEYRKLFESLLSELSKNNTFKNEASRNNINPENFAKKLLGQIVFLYFVQKKGWLGVSSGSKWGEGNKKFMGDLFREAIKKNANFYNDYLEKLFYNVLNNPRRNSVDPSFSKDFNCRIPFLNGGLFEAEYDWKDSLMRLDNNIFKTIFNVFERYNFTIEEESPDDKEVAVDPEMLGQVFENLLPENLRKGKGTYYTPREIVYYMCREALINYLISNHSNITEENVRNYIFYSESFENFKKQKGESFTPGQWKELDDLLKNIKVCDPACGSGAFLVGMLNLIIKLRIYLQTTPDSNLIPQKTEYELKKEAIQNCIYGVDIDPGAVEIAKLRLWLSLVVDYNVEDIEPLPNLDYRLMCGNSLLEEYEGVKFYNGDGNEQQATLLVDTGKQEKITELKKKVKEYFDIHDDKEKQTKRKEINDVKDWLVRSALEKRKQDLAAQRKSEEAKADMLDKKSREKYLASWGDKFLAEAKIKEVLKNLHNPKAAKPFFIWKLEFMDVFEDKKGFDVVIANPPYISFYSRQSRLDEYKEQVDVLRKTYQFTNKLIPGRLNSVMFFIEKGIKLLKNQGCLSFIIDANFHESAFKNIRKYIVENARIEYFVDRFSTFESVNSDQVMLCLIKTLPNKDHKYLYFNKFDDVQLKQSKAILQQKILSDREFRFIESDNRALLNTEPLSDFYDTVTGIQIGIGGTRKYKGADIRGLFYASSRKNKNYFPIISLKSDDFYSYCNVKFNEFLNFDIDLGYEINKSVSKCNIAIPKYEKYLCIPKVVVRQSSASITATYTEECSVAEYSAFSIKNKDRDYSLKYLLAILNSKFITFYSLANKIIKTGIKKQPQIRIKGLDSIPIVKISPIEQKPFIQIVDKILEITESSDYLENPAKKEEVKECEKQIDKMVYKLYDLTPEEIKIVEAL